MNLERVEAALCRVAEEALDTPWPFRWLMWGRALKTYTSIAQQSIDDDEDDEDDGDKKPIGERNEAFGFAVSYREAEECDAE